MSLLSEVVVLTHDNDLSDLEVDPCAITPPDSPVKNDLLSSTGPALGVNDILSILPGANKFS